MAQDARPARPARPVIRATVRTSTWLTPHVVRLELHAPELTTFPVGEFTDHYVKLLLPHQDPTHQDPTQQDPTQQDPTQPGEPRPTTRTYTVRAWDPAARLVTIDVVHHGDQGLAGPWAAAAEPGAALALTGPGGGYAPSPTADWHLLVGDASALPAIACALERIGTSAPTRVVVQVDDPAERAYPLPDGADVTWVQRGLVDAVQEVEWLPGRVHAFVHGEAGDVRDLRRWLRAERHVPLDHLSASGYWRRGRDDEAWRAVKRDWNAAAALEEQDALAGRV
jgi:NADPH-dependent ferric siderophore reductase